MAMASACSADGQGWVADEVFSPTQKKVILINSMKNGGKVTTIG